MEVTLGRNFLCPVVGDVFVKPMLGWDRVFSVKLVQSGWVYGASCKASSCGRSWYPRAKVYRGDSYLKYFIGYDTRSHPTLQYPRCNCAGFAPLMMSFCCTLPFTRLAYRQPSMYLINVSQSWVGVQVAS